VRLPSNGRCLGGEQYATDIERRGLTPATHGRRIRDRDGDGTEPVEVGVTHRARELHATNVRGWKIVPIPADDRRGNESRARHCQGKCVAASHSARRLRLEMAGTGLLTVNRIGAEVPPPGCGLRTVTCAVPAVATSPAAIAARAGSRSHMSSSVTTRSSSRRTGHETGPIHRQRDAALPPLPSSVTGTSDRYGILLLVVAAAPHAAISAKQATKKIERNRAIHRVRGCPSSS